MKIEQDTNQKYKPKYIRAYIKNVLRFYKLFLDITLDSEQNIQTLPEIIQSDLMKKIELKPDRKIGESTIIKYIDELSRWKFITITLKKRKGRYSKHLSPTIRGILSASLYTSSDKYLRGYRNILEKKIPAFSALIDNPSAIKELCVTSKTFSIFDFYVLFCSISMTQIYVPFQKLSRAENITDLKMLSEKIRTLGNKPLANVELSDFFRYILPHEPFSELIKKVKSVETFLEKLDIYLFSLLHLAMKKYLIKYKRFPSSTSNELQEYQILKSAFQKFYYLNVSRLFSTCSELFMFSTLGLHDNILSKLSKITGRDANQILQSALYRYIEELEYKIGKEKRQIFKKYTSYGVMSLNDLETLIEKKQLVETENLSDANRLRELEDQLQQIKTLKNEIKPSK